MERLALTTLVVVIALSTGAAQVSGPVLLTGTPTLIHGGPGAQVDSHLSGSHVS